MVGQRFSMTGRIMTVTTALVLVLLACGHGSAQDADKVVAAVKEGEGKAVQIEADAMEVKQEDKQAVFSGNVDAKKGNVHLTSDQLVVDYAVVKKGDDKRNKVTHLDARGNVIVVSKGQTVKAEWAKMDIEANTVVMGDKVTVIEGKSVIHGKRLEMNLTTGRSKIIGAGGRVRGTFFQ